MLVDIASPLLARTDHRPLNHVCTGTFAIYNIADLTDGRQEVADAGHDDTTTRKSATGLI